MNTAITEYIRMLTQEGFWGTLTIKLQNGQVIHVVREESLKPDQLIPDHRRNHDHINS
jgi:hypothetical protein